MYIALLANTAWIDEELPALQGLVVGLMDESVRVAQVVPRIVAEEDLIAFGERVNWLDSPIPLVRRWRLTRLIPALRERQVSLIHAMDGRLWDAATRIARRLGVPAVLTANSEMDLVIAARMVYRMGPQVAFAASTQPLADALRERLGSGVVVETVRPGVHVSSLTSPGAGAPDEPVFCAVVSGNGELDSDYEALFEAMRRNVEEDPSVQFFLDLNGPHQYKLWRAAGRFGLLGHVSMVPRRLGHREMLLRADALIQPQALGRTRHVLLRAMAAGVPVLARQDPWNDAILDERSAWVVHTTDADAWQAMLRRLRHDQPAVAALTASAQAMLREQHSSVGHISRVLHLYRRMLGETFKLNVDPQET